MSKRSDEQAAMATAETAAQRKCRTMVAVNAAPMAGSAGAFAVLVENVVTGEQWTYVVQTALGAGRVVRSTLSGEAFERAAAAYEAGREWADAAYRAEMEQGR